MIVSDLKREFYDVLAGKRVLIMVDYDIDGLCSYKILQALFRADYVLYTVVPVSTKSELKMTYDEHAKNMNDVILLNCGGTLDVVELLQPADDMTIYIADCHRPFDVCNIYNRKQVKILSRLTEEEEVPPFNDLFREDSDEEFSDEETDRFSEEMLEKRREKRLWAQRRQKLLFDYSQFSYYGGSTAVLFYELSWTLTKDTKEILWWSIVGETHLHISEKTELEKYILNTSNIQSHVSRLNHKSQDIMPLDSIRIAFEKELQLVLYRHWTVIESMKHSPYTSTTLKLWSLKGEKKMNELLAEVGLPLIECNQKFNSMDASLKKHIRTILETKLDKYGLDNLILPSFSLSYGFRNHFSAIDYALATSALLEFNSKEKSKIACFQDASKSLQVSNIEILEKGIEWSKQQTCAIYRQVKAFLNMSEVVSNGPFLVACVSQGSVDAPYFSGKNCLLRLAQFTLKAHVATARNRKSRSLPLVLTTPDLKNPIKSDDEDDGMSYLDTCIVCGVPPLSETSHKNFFGKAFEQAVEKTSARAELNFFDSNYIRLCADDRGKFFDALTSILS